MRVTFTHYSLSPKTSGDISIANTVPRPPETVDVDSQWSTLGENAPEPSQKAKQVVPKGKKTLKCDIADDTHHGAKVYAAIHQMNLGDAVTLLLSKGLAPASSAPSSEELLAKSLRHLDRALFDRIDRFRNDLRLSWHQVARQALASYETQLSESGPLVPRPAPLGDSLQSVRPRPFAIGGALGGAPPNGARPSVTPGLSATDASDSDESGTRNVAFKR